MALQTAQAQETEQVLVHKHSSKQITVIQTNVLQRGSGFNTTDTDQAIATVSSESVLRQTGATDEAKDLLRHQVSSLLMSPWKTHSLLRDEQKALKELKADTGTVTLPADKVTLAKEAAFIIRKVCSGGQLGIVEKGVNDLQTQADRSAQHCIVSSLSQKFPGLCIIGEEDLQGKDQPLSHIVEDMDAQVLSKRCPPALESAALEDVVVWVDPLDGTGEFAQPVIPPISVCDRTQMSAFTGESRPDNSLPGDKGTTQPVFEEGNPTESMNNVIVTTRSHPTPNTVAALQACAATKVLKIGGCGFKVLTLLEGVAHSYVYANSGCKRWDTCAPEALLNCIGGRLTGLDGKPYSYSKEVNPINTMGVLATPVAAWHSSYLARIPSSVVQSLSSA
nr:unnamed protein product [Spirometra erinaceieuropaei]